MIYQPASAEDTPTESEYDTVIHAIERLEVTDETDHILQRLGQELLNLTQERPSLPVAYSEALSFLGQQ